MMCVLRKIPQLHRWIHEKLQTSHATNQGAFSLQGKVCSTMVHICAQELCHLANNNAQ